MSGKYPSEHHNVMLAAQSCGNVALPELTQCALQLSQVVMHCLVQLKCCHKQWVGVDAYVSPGAVKLAWVTDRRKRMGGMGQGAAGMGRDQGSGIEDWKRDVQYWGLSLFSLVPAKLLDQVQVDPFGQWRLTPVQDSKCFWPWRSLQDSLHPVAWQYGIGLKGT